MNSRQTKIALATMSGLSLSVALAGCATDTGSSADAQTIAPTTANTPSSAAPSAAADSATGDGGGSESTYTDGTYEATGAYTSPNGQEEVDVSITLASDIITAVTVTPHASNPNSVRYQNEFADGIAAVVVGQDIDEIQVSRVAGSSLTSGGFNKAVDTIKSEAA